MRVEKKEFAGLVGEELPSSASVDLAEWIASRSVLLLVLVERR
jgi:hypothetical protein